MNPKHYPAGTGTFSKGRSQFPGNAPQFAVSGTGAHVLGSDGREYIDWTAALGAISLGYRDPDVLRATRLAADNGNVFGLPHKLEWDYADALAEILPWGDDSAVKYGKHGSDVTSAAVRAARYVTSRQIVISVGYHGWHDEFVPNRNGVPISVQDMCHHVADWKDAGVRGDKSFVPEWVAAIIVEPEAVPDLEDLRGFCTQEGIMLIFDEVLSGFRTPKYTVGQWHGVVPDYLCLAKAIGNGWPLSVVAGPSALMEPFAGAIGYSFTFGGETVSLAAGMAVLKKYRTQPVIDTLWATGQGLRIVWDSLETGLELGGNPSRLVFKYKSLAQRTLVQQEFIKRGILMAFGFIPMYAHTDADAQKTLAAMVEVAEVLKKAGDEPERLVEGELVGLPYRQMVTLS